MRSIIFYHSINTPCADHYISTASLRLHDAAYSDRFIPSRLSTNLEDALEKMENKDSSSKDKVFI